MARTASSWWRNRRIRTVLTAETRDDLLRVTGRGYTVVRHILRQLPSDVTDRVSVLGPMVAERKRRSLQLYLLLITVWPWLEGQQKPLPAAVWARAVSTAQGRQWTASNVSAAWTDLESRGLIERHRLQRGLVVAPRREDGKAKYSKPGLIKGDRRETYFVLPGEFWTEEWFEKLTLPGLAMLLIIAGETSEKEEVWLTNHDTAGWYGFSARSVEAGIEDLRDRGLLKERVEWIKAPLSAVGATQRHWYSLKGVFSTAARVGIQAAAKAELEKRTGTTRRKGATSSTTTKAAPKSTRKAAAKRTQMNAQRGATTDLKTEKTSTKKASVKNSAAAGAVRGDGRGGGGAR